MASDDQSSNIISHMISHMRWSSVAADLICTTISHSCPHPDQDQGDSTRLPPALFAGVAVAAVLLMVVVVIAIEAVLVFVRRRRRRTKENQATVATEMEESR